MNKLKTIFTTCFLVASLFGFSQEQSKQSTKLIAVVNRANWCVVCKENGQRFGELINSYTSNGIMIYLNDLTNDSTTQASKKILQEANIYDAVITVPRKGLGKMLKSCGLAKDKKQTALASGIVIFINPATQKQLKQESIAIADIEMKQIINNLLNN